MSKFKVGDEVVRTHPSSKLVIGETYIIKEILSSIPAIILEGYSNMYNLDNFELAEEINLDFDISDTLTPLQVAESLLNEEEVEYKDSQGDWILYKYGLNTQLNLLSKHKFRLKPKTMIINGVEVPAPLSKKPSQEFIYFINLFKSRVYQLPTEKLTFNHKNYWGTSEDAYKVLDAMLIPFNNLNKGEK